MGNCMGADKHNMSYKIPINVICVIVTATINNLFVAQDKLQLQLTSPEFNFNDTLSLPRERGLVKKTTTN